MWLPRWAGEIYSRLYYHFGLNIFKFKDALEALGISDNKLNMAFTYLRRAGALTIFDRGRPRMYRLMNPPNFIMLSSGYVELIRIRQERYLNVIYDFFRIVRNGYSLRAYAIYGSVARGTAREDSDIDVLLISDEFKGSISSRLDELYEYIQAVRDEISWLHEHNIYVTLSIYPLTSGEAKKVPILFLDIIHEARIVYDDGFLRRLIDIIKGKLSMIGAKRIELSDGRWYWDLKPGFKGLEVNEL